MACPLLVCPEKMAQRKGCLCVPREGSHKGLPGRLSGRKEWDLGRNREEPWREDGRLCWLGTRMEHGLGHK